MCQEFEIEIESEIIPRIAFGFAGGIGNTGAVCGAVAGAVMGISLKMEKGDTMEEGLRVLGVMQEFRRRFEAEMETISCRELTGVDLSTEKGLQQFMSSDTPQTVCAPAVDVAYRLAVNLLNETSQLRKIQLPNQTVDYLKRHRYLKGFNLFKIDDKYF